MHKTLRFAMMVAGKASALSVLMLSLSNQMGSVTGIDYYAGATPSFAACLVFVVLLLISLKWFRGGRPRFAFSVVSFLLILAWSSTAFILFDAGNSGMEYSSAMLFAYAFLGRVATLFANIQWNFHYSLEDVKGSFKPVVVSILVAFALFFTYFLLDGFWALAAVMGLLLLSGVLNVVVAWADLKGLFAKRVVEEIWREDQSHPIAEESHNRIRLLFFGSRILYGVFLGVMVGLASYSYGVFATESPLILCCIFGLVVTSVGVGLFFSEKAEMRYVAATLPVMSLIVAFLGLYPSAIEYPVCVFAMLSEVMWTTQNILQLPAYRRMTGIHPGIFSYAEYVAQVIPFYVTAWVVTSREYIFGWLFEARVEPVGVGAIWFFVLLFIVTGAVVWHIMRYLPRETVPAEKEAIVDMTAVAAQIPGLTPREKDVFALLAEGYSRPYIAKVLYIAPDTVKVHVRHIYAKLRVESHDELIALARKMQKEIEDASKGA